MFDTDSPLEAAASAHGARPRSTPALGAHAPRPAPASARAPLPPVAHRHGPGGPATRVRGGPGPSGPLAPLPAAGPEAFAPGAVSPWALRQVLEALGHGLLLLGRQGRVLYANGAAQLACRPGAPLALQGQELQPCPAELDHWALAMGAAERGQWSMLLLRAGEHTLSVGVVPLRGDELGAAEEPRVLLVLGSQGQPAGLSLQLFCRQHRLTGAESQVLSALHQGLPPESVAAQTGVAISTVRTHIAAIRHKTRSPSLRALLQSVAHLPALRGIGG